MDSDPLNGIAGLEVNVEVTIGYLDRGPSGPGPIRTWDLPPRPGTREDLRGPGDLGPRDPGTQTRGAARMGPRTWEPEPGDPADWCHSRSNHPSQDDLILTKTTHPDQCG